MLLMTLKVCLLKKQYITFYTEFMFAKQLSLLVIKPTFKTLLLKLNKECIFCVNNKLKKPL